MHTVVVVVNLYSHLECMQHVLRSSVRNKQKISLVRRTSNFENLLVRQSQHLSKQGLALGYEQKRR